MFYNINILLYIYIYNIFSKYCNQCKENFPLTCQELTRAMRDQGGGPESFVFKLLYNGQTSFSNNLFYYYYFSL